MKNVAECICIYSRCIIFIIDQALEQGEIAKNRALPSEAASRSHPFSSKLTGKSSNILLVGPLTSFGIEEWAW